MELPKLLRSKNRCLTRFLELSENFLSQARAGSFEGIEAFHAERDAILKALELYDRQIGKLASEAPSSRADREAIVGEIIPILKERDAILARIARCDEEIILKIETEQNRISQELHGMRKAQSNLNKFKSGWMPEPGEELDKKL